MSFWKLWLYTMVFTFAFGLCSQAVVGSIWVAKKAAVELFEAGVQAVEEVEIEEEEFEPSEPELRYEVLRKKPIGV